jgi:hypothetical protein
MANHLYYSSWRYAVTSRFIKAGTRDISIDNIESTHLRRPLLPGAVVISAGVAGFIAAWGDLLRLVEIVVLTGSTLAALLVGALVGVLYFQSKLFGVSAGGTVWLHPVLRKVQAAVHTALSERRSALAARGIDVAEGESGDDE